MHKVRNGTAPAVFVPKFQKLAHPYPTNFSKLNYKTNASIKQIKIQNICERSSPLELAFNRK